MTRDKFPFSSFLSTFSNVTCATLSLSMLSKALFTERTDILDGDWLLEPGTPSTCSGSVPKCSMVGLLAAAMKSSMLKAGAGLGFTSCWVDCEWPGPKDIALVFSSELRIGGGDFLGGPILLFGVFGFVFFCSFAYC